MLEWQNQARCHAPQNPSASAHSAGSMLPLLHSPAVRLGNHHHHHHHPSSSESDQRRVDRRTKRVWRIPPLAQVPPSTRAAPSTETLLPSQARRPSPLCTVVPCSTSSTILVALPHNIPSLYWPVLVLAAASISLFSSPFSSHRSPQISHTPSAHGKKPLLSAR